MKYLKISSLLVLSLLLFVPAALADVTCELRPNSQRIRMESENEMLENALTIRCTWLADIDITPTVLIATTARSISRCSSRGMLSNDDDMPPTLWLSGSRTTRQPKAATAGRDPVTATDANGQQDPRPRWRMSAVTPCIGKTLSFPTLGALVPVEAEHSRLPWSTSMRPAWTVRGSKRR